MFEKIGSRLRLLRFALDMKAEDVAHQINYSTNQVWLVERGESKPNIEFIALICEAYGISIDFLIYGTDKKFQQLINEIYSKTA